MDLCDAHRWEPWSSLGESPLTVTGTPQPHFISELSSPTALPLRLWGLITSEQTELTKQLDRAWDVEGLALSTLSLPSLTPGGWKRCR